MKKVKYYFKEYLVQSITILILLITLSALGLEVLYLFSSIYVYSQGYDNDYYYSDGASEVYLASIDKDQ
jgi:hypothetical protein